MVISHVSEHDLYPVGEHFDEVAKPLPADVEQLNAVVPDDPNVKYEHRLLCAPTSSQNIHPGEEIVKCAVAENVDAIVIGTHGRSGLSRLLAGSVFWSDAHGSLCCRDDQSGEEEKMSDVYPYFETYKGGY